MMRSKALRSVTRSLMIGKALARHGSMVMVSPSLKWRMCSWQVAVPRWPPWGMPLMTSEHMPQMPSRQSESKAIGSSPLLDQVLVHHVEHLQEGHVRDDVPGLVGLEAAGRCRRSSAAKL